MGMTVERLCEGIVQIANANMEHAIRAISVRRGYDPRDFALLAFGGSGGMHACEIAESMEIDTVLVPRYAGVLSALGMLLADVRKDYSFSILQPTTEVSPEGLQRQFAPLLDKAQAELAIEGFTGDDLVLEQLLDIRYQGQSYEIGVPLDDAFEAEFHRRHERLYGYANPSRPTEIVNIRVNAAGITRKYTLPSVTSTSLAMPEPLKVAPAWFAGRWVDTPMHDRGTLSPGMHTTGPAILCGGDATVVIPPSFSFRIDGTGTLIAKRDVRAPNVSRTFETAAAKRP
jgi:N-methylhydantoinase A/oxoprolinase/acetone carboxylase beta subunit